MKCHCGLECIIHKVPDDLRCEIANDTHTLAGSEYYFCSQHGFQGWVNTEGFEYLE